MRLENKKILITGATSGIGRGIAIRCAEEGADLIITYAHNLEKIRETQSVVRDLGRECEIIRLDLSRAEEILSLVRENNAIKEIQILVNNAGILHREKFSDISIQSYDSIMNTNLKGPFFLSQMIANLLVQRNEGGSIINISSISDEAVSPNLSHYQASKAGVSMLTKSMAYELAEHRIRVNTISPGLVGTEINRDQWEGSPVLWRERTKNIPLGRVGLPEDIASAVVFLASDESSWITGARLEVDGGSHLVL